MNDDVGVVVVRVCAVMPCPDVSSLPCPLASFHVTRQFRSRARQPRIVYIPTPARPFAPFKQTHLSSPSFSFLQPALATATDNSHQGSSVRSSFSFVLTCVAPPCSLRSSRLMLIRSASRVGSQPTDPRRQSRFHQQLRSSDACLEPRYPVSQELSQEGFIFTWLP